MFRKKQETADVILSIPLLMKDGSQAVGLTLGTLSTKIIKPDGTALAGYDEATFTEPNSDGVYVCKFPTSATNKAFTLEDQTNPYTVTLDSSTTDVEPTTVEAWIVSTYPWELSTLTIADILANYKEGVLKNLITVDEDPVEIVRGDVKKLTFNFGTQWDLTGKKVYFCMKEKKTDDNSVAKINRECTVTDAVNGVCEITTTKDETDTVKKYYAEVEVRESDESDPQTAWQSEIIIKQDVRQ
jgi:hypothetical protein